MPPTTCAEAVMQLLAAYEVDTVFGMAGTMTVELYRGIGRAGIRHVQCRNEQGASLMADGYARATGKPGVCTIIAGPGVTNAATGIAQAYCDSQPMLVLSGACPTRHAGQGLGGDPRARRPGRRDRRVHRLQRDGPLPGGAAGADRPRLRHVSRQPASPGAPVAAPGCPPGTGRGRLEDPPRPVPADARSGGDRGGRGSPGAGQASADSRRRWRGRQRARHSPISPSASARRCWPPTPARASSRNPMRYRSAARSLQQAEPAGAGRGGRGAAGRLAGRPRRPLPAPPRYPRRRSSASTSTLPN